MIGYGERPAWQENAACHDQTELFFPERYETYSSIKAARQICSACPVREQCLDYSLSLPHPWHGVYAGLTPKQRRNLKGSRHDNAVSL